MVFLLLFVVTLFIRFPFFFRDYVDRDESTFILMGQSWVDGHLPYLELWDLKPPLTFAFFAVIISIFGKSFLAIRFIGALLVTVTAFFTYKTSLKITTKNVAFWSAFSCILLFSLFGSMQGVMSEHICMAFFMPGLYLLILKKKYYWFLISGILMGVAVMVKLNIAYAILVLGLFFFYELVKNWNIKSLWNLLLFGIGISAVILLTIFPYYEAGKLLVWWKSVILASLEYAETRRFSFLKLAPTFLFIGGFLFFSWKKRWLNFNNRAVMLIFMAVLGVLLSFLKGGRINGHYLVQVYPMLVILLGIAIQSIVKIHPPKLPKTLLYILLLIPTESYLEYVNIVWNKLEKGTFFNGEGFTVPEYINSHNLDKNNILFFGYHIGYWNLDSSPPTKASTHPSNICRDEIFPFFDNPRKNSMEELRFIMEELRPKTVVVRKDRLVFDRKEIEENEYIDAYLAKHYKVYAVVENAEILQRL